MDTITTTEAQAGLLRLLSWMSPFFPVGAFAYSHGLERAIHEGLVRDRETLIDWLSGLLTSGSAWNDAVLFAAAWRDGASGGDAGPAAELAAAMAGSRERHMEATLQGAAFTQAIRTWEGRGDSGDAQPIAYCVAVGHTAAAHGLPLADALTAYLHAFTANLIQAAQRLVPLGQRDAVAALATLVPCLLATTARASVSTLDDLGSNTFISEIMAMQHEVQYSRVFRS
jgi:urease accessory protein